MSYIEIFDDKMDGENIKEIFKTISMLMYRFGERDNRGSPPTGMVAELNTKKQNRLEFVNKLNNLYMSLCPMSESYSRLHRAYVNIFAPREMPYYHPDGNCMTLLYYANPVWQLNEGGETKIQRHEREVFSIAPIPGRIAIFNGSLQHTATSFRNMHRFTVALKFNTSL